MPKIDTKFAEETGIILPEEEPVAHPAKMMEAHEMPEERGRKGGARMPEKEEHGMEAAPMMKTEEECRGLDLGRKQSIGDLSCGRIQKK